MEKVILGQTGLEISRVVLGTARFTGHDPEPAHRAIRHAFDAGINCFDTARTYGSGEAEAVLGTALRDQIRRERSEIVISSKGGLCLDDLGAHRDASAARMLQDLEESLRTLGTDHIDLYHVHWPDRDVPFAETAAVLEEAVLAGKLSHLALSNFNVEEMTAFAQAIRFEAIQPSYGLFSREIEADVLPYAAENQLGVLAYGVLGHGLLSGTLTSTTTFPPEDWRSMSPMYQGDRFRTNVEAVGRLEVLAREEVGCSLAELAVAWVLRRPEVHGAIVGSARIGHIDAAIAATEIVLPEEALAEIELIMADASPGPGPTPETA